MKSLIVLTLLVLAAEFASCERKRYDNYAVYRLHPKDENALRILSDLQNDHSLDLDFWTEPRQIDHPVDVMVPPSRVNLVQGLINHSNIQGGVWISNVQEHIDAERVVYKSSSNGNLTWDQYYDLDAINAWLESLAERYPDQVTLLKPGRTYEGREVVGVRVSFRPGNENRSVFMEANIHAREWISSAVNTFILNEFLTSTNETIRAVADSHDWYFFPVFNPDGFVYSHTEDRMWRKTRTPYGRCRGVDPNRNWGYHWMHGGSSNAPCSETYAGPKAFSELSTRTMSEFITTIGPQLLGYIDFHSYSQFLLIPYGDTDEHLDNYDEIYAIGLEAAKALSKRYGTQYEVGNIVEVIYVASGGSVDWVKGNFHTPVVYAYELRDTGKYGFVLPSRYIIPTALETLDSLLVIFQRYAELHPEAY